MKTRKFLVQVVLAEGQELTANGRTLLDSVAGWVTTGLCFHSAGRMPLVFVTEEECREPGTTPEPVPLDGSHFAAPTP